MRSDPYPVGIDSECRAAISQAADLEIDSATNKHLFWKVNKRILVVMLGLRTLGFNSIMRIQKDANLHGNSIQYSWLGTILYMGLLAGEYPTNLLLQKLPVAKYLAANVFCWGTVIACSAAVTNFRALMYRTAMWYTREEQSVLTSLRYCMTGVQLMVGGLIVYGTSHLKHAAIHSWQLLFLALGGATTLWACFISRPVVWCCVLQLTSTLIIGGLGVFSNLVISHFGFTVLQMQLLNITQGGVTILVMVGSAALAQKIEQTLLIMLIWILPAISGTGVILGIVPTHANAAGLLIAFYCTQFILAEGNMIFSLSCNIAGQTKKSITFSMTFVAWAAGNMTAPQLFQTNDAPRYRHGFTAHLCLDIIFIAEIAATRLLLYRRNKHKAAAAATTVDRLLTIFS
ncbi:MFS general substrate transporter [Zopfia rhizophila CBS 207.26]|uniref:MFS general substrate transporter n=1 Tax=Zopfia rhizophila CBS 207.26 TaxID=1314779 RepID=A0A6A6DW76_9PEZI|nr:MFS general substrate transporter [Zopfia rhizophila CBS 207.26]